MKQKINIVLKILNLKNMQANIFITDSDYSCTDKSFEYLLGFQPTLWWIVLTESKLYIILDSRYFLNTANIDEYNIKNIIWNENLEINYIEAKNIIDEIIKLCKNSDKIVIEWKVASEYTKQIRKQSGKNIEILEWWYFSEKRIEKNEVEKETIKVAIDIIDEVFLEIEKQANSWELMWKTELQVRGMIINKIFELWWSWESFESIVAFWPNSAIPHHKTWSTIIWNGSLLIDMWALYNWYCSDFTRTIWIWEKKWEEYNEFIKIYNIVKQAHLNAFEKTEEWMIWKEIDFLAREYIEKQWYWEEFSHSLWHWVWLDIHETPWINKKDTNIIKNNMVFTIEPGIYLEWKFWIRLEDIVFVENWELKKHTKVKL